MHMTVEKGSQISGGELLPKPIFGGSYVLKVVPSDPDGFVFVGENEMVDLADNDQFITMPKSEMLHLLQRTPAHMFPGIPAVTSAERMAIGQTVKIKTEARKLAGSDEKRYRREMKRLSREHVRDLQRQIKEMDRDREAVKRKIVSLERKEAMALELDGWLLPPFMLQRPDGSSLHRLQKAYKAGDWLIMHSVEDGQVETISEYDHGADLFDDLESFVIEHDWAKALDGADISGQGGEIQVGAPVSAFEFMINDRRVIGVVVDREEEHTRRMLLTCELANGWALLRPYKLTDTFEPVSIDAGTPAKMKLNSQVQPLANLVAKNIKAICIMLEAEVAQTEVIRVDAKLNRAREKRGKLPLSDYHVVSLTRRDRVLPRAGVVLDPDREIRHVRMHFRRGHWRHYENHRTWVRWCLVGDPDLGIIEKHYRL